MMKYDILELSFSKVPMLKALGALMLGIILGKFIDFSLVFYLPYIIFVQLILLIVLYFYLTPSKKIVFVSNFYLSVILLGIWIISHQKPSLNLQHFSHYAGEQIVGIVADEPVIKEKSIRFPITVFAVVDSAISYPVSGKLMVTYLRDSISEEYFRYGDQFIFINTISETQPPFNPKQFDYKGYLSNKGIWHQAFLRSGEIHKIDVGKGSFILDQSLLFRQKLIAKFRQYIADPEAYQIAIALIFGYRSQVEASTLEAFTDTGTVHVLSVSGLHVSLVFGFLTLLLFWMDKLKYGKQMRCFFIFIAVWFYVILTGMSPPILRAGIMISFFIVSTAFGRRQIGLNTLFASAFFILLFAPHYLFDVGFQLSYAAILGILILYPIAKDIWLPSNRWLAYIVEYCYVSISAQLFTLPLALYYFGQFPVYFLIANLFIALPSTAIMYLGVLLALSPFDFVNHYIGILLDWLLIFSVNGLQFISNLPMAVSKGIVWEYWQILLLCIVLMFTVLSLNYANKKALFRMMFFLLLLIIYSTIQQFKFKTYSGLRVYNIRSEIAIAEIHKGQVLLFSTLDSLTHPTLGFSVLPDLLQFVDENDIVFKSLNNDVRENYELELGDKRFLILEDHLSQYDSISYDYILFRENNRNDINSLLKQNKHAKIIIDGSNSDKNIYKLDSLTVNSNAVYLLKNNFAYVWDRE